MIALVDRLAIIHAQELELDCRVYAVGNPNAVEGRLTRLLLNDVEAAILGLSLIRGVAVAFASRICCPMSL